MIDLFALTGANLAAALAGARVVLAIRRQQAEKAGAR